MNKLMTLIGASAFAVAAGQANATDLQQSPQAALADVPTTGFEFDGKGGLYQDENARGIVNMTKADKSGACQGIRTFGYLGDIANPTSGVVVSASTVAMQVTPDPTRPGQNMVTTTLGDFVGSTLSISQAQSSGAPNFVSPDRSAILPNAQDAAVREVMIGSDGISAQLLGPTSWVVDNNPVGCQGFNVITRLNGQNIGAPGLSAVIRTQGAGAPCLFTTGTVCTPIVRLSLQAQMPIQPGVTLTIDGWTNDIFANGFENQAQAAPEAGLDR